MAGSFKLFYQDQSRRKFLYKMSMERWSSMQELQHQEDGFQNSPAVHTVKDQEWLIQDLKKENFDLKLRLFMEQKEREKLLNGNSRQTDDLESDLTEALDELEHAMDKENQLSHELNAARRREKSLATKLKRLERVCQHQEEDIIRMSVELENLKMEMAAKDSGIASPNAPRTRTLQNRSGRMSPTSDFYSDRLSAGYPDRYWDRYSDRNSDRGSDSGSYVTTPHERKTFFGDRFPDDMSTSDESETKHRTISTTASDVERNKRREKLLSRRVRHYQDIPDNEEEQDVVDGNGRSADRIGDANQSPRLERLKDDDSNHQERAIDVAPDIIKTTPETNSGQKRGTFPRPRWFQKKSKGNKQTSKSMDELNSIGRIDVKNIHKKNKKYNFWGCVRARESINENIRSEYAPVKRPQVKNTESTPKTTDQNNGVTNGDAAPVDYI
ncbi:uncharacterized protein LOC114522027 isoform X2 [Dendronephthya gigantea]|uniref:uncharacterized protein LOC114522027 isoform X2 n=2 Tax=Dendronephthya gigantea TaxID=151771 RepID=UPI0010690D0C|nr:uncharacterized protein LOC114522027 isoform X2 [Dendronephthya gigantea]